MNCADKITVIMSSSPIPSHPSTEIIDKVLAGIWNQLPGVRVFLMCDGVRIPEHASRIEAYKEYKRRVLHNGGQLMMSEWEDSVQQAFMTREALKHVQTPLVLWDEHDYLITADRIDWEGNIRVIEAGLANVVRFHNLEHIHPLHQHLMLDCFEGADGEHGGRQICEPPLVDGVPLIRTIQFWACPFLTTTKWFREQMEDPRKFSAETYCEIEPALYTWVNCAPWDEYKVMVYAPSEPSMRRSQHLGGRGHDNDDPKRDMRW
jgi:hypothetical protein